MTNRDVEDTSVVITQPIPKRFVADGNICGVLFPQGVVAVTDGTSTWFEHTTQGYAGFMWVD